MLQRACVSVDRSQPSLNLFQRHEENDTHQNYEADRSVGASEVIALGKVGNQLAESAKIDEKFRTDDIDERKYEPQPDADKDRRQGCRKEDLPYLLSAAQVKAAANIDQHTAGPGNSFDRLQNDRRQPRDKSHHDDGPRVATENDHKEGIGKDERRRSKRRDPSLASLSQEIVASQKHANCDATNRNHGAGS